MPIISIDFENVQDFEPLAPGEYPVVVDHVEVRTGKDSGQPYLNWDLVIAEGEFVNRHLFMMSGLTEKSLWRLKTTLKNLGILEPKMDFIVDDESNYLIQPQLVGLAGTAVVEVESYNGRLQNRVQDLLPPQGQTVPAARAAAATQPPLPTPPSRTPKLNLH